MGRSKAFAVALVALATAIGSSAATASVRYDFTALSSDDVGPGFGTITGSFSYTAPTFVTPDVFVPAASMSDCTYLSTTGTASCSSEGFYNTIMPGYDTIIFSGNTPGGSVGVYYYFDPSAFGNDGTYSSLLFGSTQAATLQVTSSSTPEPTSWALMMIGIGGIGAVMRRRLLLAA
jgi:hypothetical protein